MHKQYNSNTGYKVIEERYSGLAKKSACLSCGGAINYADIKADSVCLDLGSGRGREVFRMAEQAGYGKVYGIDISEGMLDEARSRASEHNYNNIEFIRAPFESIPVKDDEVDVLISNCSINHADDKGMVWKEIYRVLKPGGHFVVSDIYSAEEVPVKYSKDPQAIAECWAGAVTKDVYMHMIEDAGFYDIEILEESDPYEKGKIEVSSFTIRGKV